MKDACHECRAFVNGISAFIKEAPESFLPLSLCEDTVETGNLQLGRQPLAERDHAWCLDFGHSSLQKCEKFLTFISYPVCGIFLQRPEETKTLPLSHHFPLLLDYKSPTLSGLCCLPPPNPSLNIYRSPPDSLHSNHIGLSLHPKH